MKTIKRLFLQTLLTIVFVTSIIACETDCVNKETIIENKLTPEVLSYFPYDSLDTIHCIIDSQQNLTIRSFEKEEGISVTTKTRYAKCGENVTYYNHYRIVNYFDENGKIILVVKLQLVDRSAIPIVRDPLLEIDFNFYNLPFRGNYQLGIDRGILMDTLTLNGRFYNDIYTSYYGSYVIYYSKAEGLVQIKDGGAPLFQLIQ